MQSTTISVIRQKYVARPANIDYLHETPRPLWRGRLHVVATLMIPFAAAFLLIHANNWTERLSSAIYALSLLLVYAVSGAYHVVARTLRSQHIFRRLDHAAIFLLIAGSYTPVCLLVLPHKQAYLAVSAVWLVAAGGVLLKISGRAWRFATGLYLGLGWSALITCPSLYRQAGGLPTFLFISGGIIYTVGTILFLTQHPKLHPATFGYHEFWHMLTICAGIAQFAAIVMLLNAV